MFSRDGARQILYPKDFGSYNFKVAGKFVEKLFSAESSSLGKISFFGSAFNFLLGLRVKVF